MSYEQIDQEEFDKKHGAKVQDDFCGIVTDNFGQISIALFIRKPPESPFPLQSQLPMLVNKGGEIFAVVNCSNVKGIFKKKVQLTLNNESGQESTISIPLNQVVRGFEDSIADFLAFAHSVAPIISVMPIMDFIFIKKVTIDALLTEFYDELNEF
jgi:hypothetical protein